MPDISPYLTLHSSQIRDIATSIKVDDAACRKASPESRAAALRACADAGIEVPSTGYFTVAQLDQAIATAFDKAMPTSIDRRLQFKAQLSAGGLIAEPSTVNKETVVRAALMLKKAGIPLPDGKPYSLAQFDALMAAKSEISLDHRWEIKSAAFAAGLIEQSAVAKSSGAAPPIAAAKHIVSFP
jgi:hypothetical protein